jgi:hypothetical protein
LKARCATAFGFLVIKVPIGAALTYVRFLRQSDYQLEPSMRQITKLGRLLMAAVAGGLFVYSASAAAQTCEDGHWIESVIDDGRLIRLEDGSLWQVNPIDTITSSIWLPVSNIIICGGRLINEDDNEAVNARRIR